MPEHRPNGPKPRLSKYLTRCYGLAAMRVFKTRTFDRSMKRSGMTDRALWGAVLEMAKGLVDADLGGHVVKKRVALPGLGKRGGARTIVATKLAERWFFLYGFRKNERANIDKDELRALQEVAKDLLGLDDRRLDSALEAGEILEVRDGDEEA
jgi:hypothetical protein